MTLQELESFFDEKIENINQLTEVIKLIESRI